MYQSNADDCFLKCLIILYCRVEYFIKIYFKFNDAYAQ